MFIPRQTIHDPVPFRSSVWRKVSPDAKLFVDSNLILTLDLLNKDPKKRSSINEVLEHPWLIKYNNKLCEVTKKKKDNKNCYFELYTNTG
jgi:serine/threonine protein kinase